LEKVGLLESSDNSVSHSIGEENGEIIYEDSEYESLEETEMSKVEKQITEIRSRKNRERTKDFHSTKTTE
jgi:hypothetical protein